MNLPNKLSILRVLCIPVIVVLMILPGENLHWAAAAVFLIASLTDFLDGHIARSQNLVTDFGKFIDPVADKLLVLSTLIMLVHQQLFPAWGVVIILARELSVDGLRLVASGKGTVIAAGPLGKIKTTLQMIMILYLLVFVQPVLAHPVGIVLFILVLGMTIVSGIDYFRRNSALLKGSF